MKVGGNTGATQLPLYRACQMANAYTAGILSCDQWSQGKNIWKAVNMFTRCFQKKTRGKHGEKHAECFRTVSFDVFPMFSFRRHALCFFLVTCDIITQCFSTKQRKDIGSTLIMFLNINSTTCLFNVFFREQATGVTNRVSRRGNRKMEYRGGALQKYGKTLFSTNSNGCSSVASESWVSYRHVIAYNENFSSWYNPEQYKRVA